MLYKKQELIKHTAKLHRHQSETINYENQKLLKRLNGVSASVPQVTYDLQQSSYELPFEKKRRLLTIEHLSREAGSLNYRAKTNQQIKLNQEN